MESRKTNRQEAQPVRHFSRRHLRRRNEGRGRVTGHVASPAEDHSTVRRLLRGLIVCQQDETYTVVAVAEP